MISISRFTKSFIAIIIAGVVLTFFSCSKSDQEKAACLLKEHAKTIIADYESFEIIQIDTIREVYSDVYDEKELRDISFMYYYYLDSINSMKSIISELNDYIDENIPVLEDLVRRSNSASWRYLSSFSGSSYYNHLTAENDYISIKESGMRLAKELDKADAMRKSLQQSVSNCDDTLLVLQQRTTDYYYNYKPKYLGRGTTVKCRYRAENANMKLITYKAVFNEDISALVAIKDVTVDDNQSIKAFVDGFIN
jgi:hypothetical protein